MLDEIEFKQDKDNKYIWESKYIRIGLTFHPREVYTISVKIRFSSFDKAEKAGKRLGEFIAGLRAGG